jgi:BASS family bile acid:Na+ symporter
MELKELLSSFAQITVFAVMLSMGMALGFGGMGRLWRRPSLLLRCFLAAFVVVPLAAMVVTRVLPLPFEVRAGIAAMAVIPGAPY